MKAKVDIGKCLKHSTNSPFSLINISQNLFFFWKIKKQKERKKKIIRRYAKNNALKVIKNNALNHKNVNKKPKMHEHIQMWSQPSNLVTTIIKPKIEVRQGSSKLHYNFNMFCQRL